MYDETVYLLDLCILAYQLHAQTLIWPMDPYYEQVYDDDDKRDMAKKRRDAFMSQVRTATANRPDLHGPGPCQGDDRSGWRSNLLLDPIIANYARIYPWRPSFTRPNRENEKWIVYNTPSEITDLINEVRMVRYDSNAGPFAANPTIQPDVIHRNRPALNRPKMPAATDLLYCFEGGTGAIGGDSTQKQYAAWSMMGFVLARTVTDVELKLSTANLQNPQPVGYDIYIVFRGSRSGALRPRAALAKEKGNPDWVTDLDLFQLVADPEISAHGSVCRGFRTSIKSMLPTVVKAMTEIDTAKKGAPRNIYVTGHSLGGALACHFTSAMVFGTKYGPNGVGKDMPDSLKRWPWRSVQLVTYSAPVVGSPIFKSYFDMSILSRRVWLDGDPITQEQENCLVGVPCRISVRDEELKETTMLIAISSHEPYLVRRNLIRRRLWLSDDMTRKSGLPGVPAGTGKEHADEPWKLFKVCAEMLKHLELVQRTRNSMPLVELFPDFNKYFDLYLNILKTRYDQNSKPRLNVENLRTNLGNIKGSQPQDLKKLEGFWTGAKYIETTDPYFYNFIGLCLFLANLSEGFGSRPNDPKMLIDLIMANDAYTKLLNRDI